ncbi:TldD/PmbA family protein [Candidatus Saganbacteria bacterium]|nr:TldD/PmbA family protein [Candidatus Saganbacteria bacterium]
MPLSPQDILKKINIKGIDQAEVYLALSRTLTIDVLDSRVEAIKEITETGYALRLIKNNQLGFAYTTDSDEFVLAETINRAIKNSDNVKPDEYNFLPRTNVVLPKDLIIYDPQIDKISIQEKTKLSLQIENAAYEFDPRVKKTEKIQYSDTSTEIWLVNSYGLSLNYKTNHCGAFAQIVAGHDRQFESGFGANFVKNFTDFEAEAIGQQAAQHACELLSAQAIPSQKISLVFAPDVGVEILSALIPALSAESVQKGKSMFSGKISQYVASNLFTLIDDGRLTKGLGAAPFDGEGVPTQETSLIENGRLNTFLHNTYTAAKDKTRSTGNAIRPTLKGLPVIGTTNLYLKPGSQSPGELIKALGKGLYITRVMGMHTVNPISGNFSVGAAGILIENGQKTQPVNGITIAGNLLEMLCQISAVANDLRFVADTGSPTIVISDMTVSGT